MSYDPFPKDAIFVKWGRFQAGVFGRLAIVSVIMILALIVIGRALSLW